MYTFPMRPSNTMNLGMVRGSHQLTDDLLLSGNAFYRDYQRHTFNGDARGHLSSTTPAARRCSTPAARLVHLGRCQGPSAGFVDSAGNPLAGTLQREAEAEDRNDEDQLAGLGHHAAAIVQGQGLRSRQ